MLGYADILIVGLVVFVSVAAGVFLGGTLTARIYRLPRRR